KSINIV
ncbi:unnamed protein product, partial [Allacma fusca]